MYQLWLAFLTGLTTGGLSCFAVQGGLLAANLGNQNKENQKSSVVYFLLGKTASYTILGGLLGLIGSQLIVSPKLQGVMQILAGIFMLTTAGKLLDLHPIFRKFTLTPPKSFFRLLRSKSVNEGTFSSTLLGLLTVLIPCGVTQAMMILSVSSGSIVQGALIMFFFTLGTSPVFFALGMASTKIFKIPSLKYLASFAILYLAVTSINSGQILRGSPHTIQNYYSVIKNDSFDPASVQAAATVNKDGVQEVNINIFNNGYKSNTSTLKANTPVSLKLSANKVMGCSRAFTIPEYDIYEIVPETGETTIEFTPTKKGRLTYTCSMGMYSGFFNVI